MMTPSIEWGAVSTLVVLSPHLDDAVLSCGGLIAHAHQQGADVLVVTAFNGRATPPVSEPARKYHSRCGLPDDLAMTRREGEDDLALGVVGARTQRLFLPEALYRKREDGRPMYEGDQGIFLPEGHPTNEATTDVEQGIAEQVADASPDLILAPLGIGGHVDHVLVSQAARRLAGDVLYYEDMPYAIHDRCRGWQENIAVTRPRLHSCDTRAWAAKIQAITCYRSQSSVLWERPSTWQTDLASYARTTGNGHNVERYWERT